MEWELLLSSLMWYSLLHLNVCLKLLLKAKLGLTLSGGPLPLAECANIGGSEMLKLCDTRSDRLGKSESQVMIFTCAIFALQCFQGSFCGWVFQSIPMVLYSEFPDQVPYV